MFIYLYIYVYLNLCFTRELHEIEICVSPEFLHFLPIYGCLFYNGMNLSSSLFLPSFLPSFHPSFLPSFPPSLCVIKCHGAKTALFIRLLTNSIIFCETVTMHLINIMNSFFFVFHRGSDAYKDCFCSVHRGADLVVTTGNMIMRHHELLCGSCSSCAD